MSQKNSEKYIMRMDLNVLNHLGINLYSNVPAVLSEVVANSWDADATMVTIQIKTTDDEIIIEDNGHGMSLEDINAKFLTIGYAKRKKGEVKSRKLLRDVMGRKGIGKLSLFSISDWIEIYSVSENGEKNGFLLDSQAIQEQISQGVDLAYHPVDLPTDDVNFSIGTRIVLKKLKKRLVSTIPALRKRLARRFSIIGAENDFEVDINGKAIDIEDRDYLGKIQYLWYYGEESKVYSDLADNAERSECRPNTTKGGRTITGWIGLVKESTQLQDGDDNLNRISLLMRGKLSKEDLLEIHRDGGLYVKYIIGEIRADFLDENDMADIATSSRQGIVEEDDRFVDLKEFLWDELKHIQRKREEYKSDEGQKEAMKIEPIKNWYKSLIGDDKDRAKKLFSKINQITVDEKHRNELFAHGVLAFESFKYKNALSALESISTENLDDFLKIFKDFDEIEASLYYKITKERLQIIASLKQKVHEEDALEKVLQEYLFKHLWLMDPAWDRATENAYMEERVYTEFGVIDAKLNEDEKKGRIDIKYKKPTGKHVIIELKRAKVKTDVNTLMAQVGKYSAALRKLLRESTKETHPIIEAVCVVGRPLNGWEDPEQEERDRKQMETQNVRLITYQQLIDDAYNSYKEYMDQNKEAGRILTLIQEIENSVML